MKQKGDEANMQTTDVMCYQKRTPITNMSSV
jgi:hypothetical protein